MPARSAFGRVGPCGFFRYGFRHEGPPAQETVTDVNGQQGDMLVELGVLDDERRKGCSRIPVMSGQNGVDNGVDLRFILVLIV